MSGEGIEKIINSKSRTFLSFCFSFIFGVGFFSFYSFAGQIKFYIFVSFFGVGFLLILFWSNKIKRFFFFCLLFFMVGGYRFYWSVPAESPSNLSYYNGQKIFFLAKVNFPPQTDQTGVRVVVESKSMAGHKISGRALLFLPAYSDFKFGQLVSVQCDLKAPVGKDNFVSYDKYLARDGIWSICNRPKVKVLSSVLSNWEKILSGFYDFKQKIQNQIEWIWPEPESSLIAGLLYGSRSGFTADLKQDFSISGITHIVAVSGYNISIVASIFINSLLRFGINRLKAFWVAVVGIILFVLFTGASASVVRAGIMGVLVLLSSWLGRLSRIGNILVFTAALMLLANPFVLVWDAGFQLSFLSTLGLVYLSPIINLYFFKSVKLSIVDNLRENFVSTISAIIVTLPLILFQFGRLSLVAPLTNLLVLWTIPFLMLAGFVSLILSYLFFPLAKIIAWFAYLGSEYVIIVAKTLAHWPAASFNFYLSWWGMSIIYILLFSLIFKINNPSVKNNII